MASQPVSHPSAPHAVRTQKHEHKILSEAIAILKKDVAKAEAKRLKATRLKEERNVAFKQLKSGLESFKQEIEEEKLIGEFLSQDIEILKNEILENERHSRLSGESEDRVLKLDELLKEKNGKLTKIQDRERTTKRQLEDFMTTFHEYQKSVKGTQTEQNNQNSSDDGGGGDIQLPADPRLLAMKEELQKITRIYEDYYNQRESLEQEIQYNTTKRNTIKTKVDQMAEVMKLKTAELRLKQRQLLEAERKNTANALALESKDEKVKAAEEAISAAEKNWIEADDHVRTVKKLLRLKIGELAKLEGRTDREEEIKKLKRFSKNVSECIPPPIDEHYGPGLERKSVTYLQNVIKGSTERIYTPFWTDDLEGLALEFRDRHKDLRISPRKGKPKSRNKKSSVQKQAQSTLWQGQSGDTTGIEGGQYKPPPSLPCFQMPSHSSTVNGNPRKNRISPTAKASSPKSYRPGILERILFGIGNKLAKGIDKYPKLLVVNGTMFKLQDKVSQPEVVFGPLPLSLWRRHQEDNLTQPNFRYKRQTPNICKYLIRRALLGSSA